MHTAADNVHKAFRPGPEVGTHHRVSYVLIETVVEEPGYTYRLRFWGLHLVTFCFSFILLSFLHSPAH